MKKYFYTLFILIAGCSGDNKKTIEELIKEGNLEELQQRRSNLIIQKGQINNELNEITEGVSVLDTAKSFVLVNTIYTKKQTINHYSKFQGIIKTDQNMILYPEFSGRITKVYVEEGDQVSKGQSLAKIDDGGLYNELKLVESQTKLAKTIYERQSKLWEDKIGSEIQYLEAQTNYDIQRNRLESLKQSLAKTTIDAPFNGTIDEIFIEEGNLVSPPMMPDQGNAFRIVNLNKLYVEAVIPESFIGKIKKGAEVLVDIPVLSKSFKSKIKHSVSSINQLSRTFKIEVSVPKNNLDLIPNLNVEVNILDYSNSEAILVPESIVSEDSDNNKFIYIILNQKAKKTIVETGYTQNGMIEITSGLSLNQTVINEGGRIVKDGQNVKIYNDNE
ncbi:MAG: efflux RND transporter periplasmic adaptor subunit [Flavobacteriaceae bacterium]|nr:efflux RND transporter periplasmic adaptor subunit [Flavobacteriaceae bacterium]MBL6685189.1 efflux RND transporter periplasmic adaptor subunit [Flavobacteriaceae bacterium]PDH50857.1 MAG: efflux transporter periplasmic adaptor subunit [Cryomorphaceae bacterium MED-G14]|tara:strand:- start:4032 stop:5195 length:1164 start_codon:yes stop_codon:yes gene_type:complete